MKRCPTCGGSSPQAAEWCSLCFADLRPRPPAEPASVVTAEPARPSAVQARASVTTEALVGAGPQWPCAGCGTWNPLEATACSGCGAGFLAGAAQPDDTPAVLAPLVGLSRAARMLVGLGVAVGFMLLVLLAALVTS